MTDLTKLLEGYQAFRNKYHKKDNSVMQQLAKGQQPKILVVACCDSRVDPAILLQCDPGELFVVRNVANIVPPCESDEFHHGTSAALEFAVCYLEVEHIIILGHSQCGGIQALMNKDELKQDEFISHWMTASALSHQANSADELAQQSLKQSKQNCLTFPWLKQRVDAGKLTVDCWFFEIENAQLKTLDEQNEFKPI